LENKFPGVLQIFQALKQFSPDNYKV